LALALEIAAEPSFPLEEIERQRRQRLAELLRLRAEPGFQAQEKLVRALYGDRHPYGTPLLGTADSLAAVDREAVTGFYRRHYRPAGAYAVTAGDVDPEAIAAALESVLGGAAEARGEAPQAPDLEPPPAAGVRVHLVDRPAAAQTQILLGQPGIPRTHPDFVALSVVTTLLGGKFTSRINLNLRERHGYTYGASCSLGGRLGPAPLTVSAAVANPVAGAAIREVLAELRRIREEPVGEAELDETRDYLIGVFPYTLQTVSGLAGRLETLAVYGLPDDYYAGYAERLRAIGPDRIAEVAQRHLRPDDLAVVAVGPAAELGPQLEGIGEVVAGG
jgi:zinc protease